jgi:hypothetical protein
VIEFTWGQIKDFCNKYGLKTVEEYFYGKAEDLYPGLWDTDVDSWRGRFLAQLDTDQSMGMGDVMCRYNENKVPSEGIVLKVDNLFEDKVFKLKNWKFYENETKELDSGATNIEDNQEAGE